MAERTARFWECDRCGTKEETKQNEQPTDWSALLMWGPPLTAPGYGETEDNPRKHLCRQCARTVAELVTTPPPDGGHR